MPRKLISVILPVHNQADHIEKLVLDYEAAVSRIPSRYEFVLVVNNSQDTSLEICNALSRRNRHIHVIQSAKGGWGWAVRLGLRAARGNVLCYTNSARTQPQDLQLFLLYSIAQPHCVIKANRRFRDSLLRRLGSLLYNLEVRMLFNVAYWDINGTPKIFPRSFGKLLQLTEDGDTIDAEFNVVCSQEGYPVLEVPVASVVRRGGKSTTGYGSAVRMYFGVYRLWRRKRKAAK